MCDNGLKATKLLFCFHVFVYYLFCFWWWNKMVVWLKVCLTERSAHEFILTFWMYNPVTPNRPRHLTGMQAPFLLVSLSLAHTASPHTICGPAQPCPARLQPCFVSSSRAARSCSQHCSSVNKRLPFSTPLLPTSLLKTVRERRRRKGEKGGEVVSLLVES